ncbi:MAG: hypothetical protein ACI8ZB_003405 [Desulforhopalus sp.]
MLAQKFSASSMWYLSFPRYSDKSEAAEGEAVCETALTVSG